MDADEKRTMEDLVAQIKPLLAGRHPEVVSAVLADLVSIWLAGHVAPDSKAATESHRRELLTLFFGLVTELVPINARRMGLPW